jgi:hypothetical protein
LKDKEIMATDQQDLHVTASSSLQVLGCEDAPESATKNDDTVPGLVGHLSAMLPG